MAQDAHRLLRLGIQELGGGSLHCQVVVFCHYFRPQQAEERSRDVCNGTLYFWCPCDPPKVPSFCEQPQVAPNVGVCRVL